MGEERVHDGADIALHEHGQAEVPAQRYAECPSQQREYREKSSTLGSHPERPRLLVGFAAETDDLLANAAAKRLAKKADWIVANDVSGDVMGGSSNHLHLVTADGTEDLGPGSKEALARTLLARIAQDLA